MLILDYDISITLQLISEVCNAKIQIKCFFQHAEQKKKSKHFFLH